MRHKMNAPQFSSGQKEGAEVPSLSSDAARSFFGVEAFPAAQDPQGFQSGASRCCLALLVGAALMVGGCNRDSAELNELRAENDRLKMALAQARAAVVGMHDGNDTPVADLDLSIADLWAQRFEDNQFRSKMRLDQKQIRVTGIVESVSERSVVIFGTGTRIGSVSLMAQLDEAYVTQVREGLAALQKGREITLQGRFVFEKMGLQDAAIIDRQTGWRLTSKDLANVHKPAASISVAGDTQDPLTGRVVARPDLR